MSETSPADEQAALRIAEQIRAAEANGQQRSWRKISTLVNEFGGTRLTPELRDRMSRAIDSVGLEVEPPLDDPELTRADTVRLLTRGHSANTLPYMQGNEQALDPSVVPEDTNVVAFSAWFPGESPQRDGHLPTTDEPVMLLQVNPNSEPVQELTRIMQPYCDGLLTEDLVENLLKADSHPELDVSSPAVRRLSTLGATATDDNEQLEDDQSLCGSLDLAPVEFLIGDRWLVICWHNFVSIDTEGGREGIGNLREAAIKAAERAWVSGTGKTAGDLAALVSIALARGYNATMREMESWLDQWEQRAGIITDDEHLEVQTLVDLQIQLSEFARRLRWFREIRSRSDDSWFAASTSRDLVRSLTHTVDKSLERLDHLRSSVRACSDLANMHNLRYQLGIADKRQQDEERARQAEEAARKRVEQFQRNLSYLAAIFLAPGLVAAIYGSNTELPGQDTWLGLFLLIGLMALAAVAALGAIAYFRRRQELMAAKNEEADDGAETSDVESG